MKICATQFCFAFFLWYTWQDVLLDLPVQQSLVSLRDWLAVQRDCQSSKLSACEQLWELGARERDQS